MAIELHKTPRELMCLTSDELYEILAAFKTRGDEWHEALEEARKR